ncbi:hypothetical protein EYF80_008665 [Liparis tanakae]|uniref:Uncharacterized protein n=1 Tax=Liparis tanakae TaxID=230148 RepID=A0A4Z2ISM8_9TELE|nr:hypothetical protein EYF80_008665 [Liparis tanakae]
MKLFTCRKHGSSTAASLSDSPPDPASPDPGGEPELEASRMERSPCTVAISQKANPKSSQERRKERVKMTSIQRQRMSTQVVKRSLSTEHIPPALTPPSPASPPTPMALCFWVLLALLWRGRVLPFRAWVGEGLVGVPDPVGLPPALAVSTAVCASLMISSSSTGTSTTALKRRFTRAAPIVVMVVYTLRTERGLEAVRELSPALGPVDCARALRWRMSATRRGAICPQSKHAPLRTALLEEPGRPAGARGSSAVQQQLLTPLQPEGSPRPPGRMERL